MNELYEEIVGRLVARFQPEQIILFGSRAWGKPDDESDLDLMVIVPVSALSPAKRAVMAHKALCGLGMAKDVIVKTRDEFDRYRHVRASLECRVAEDGKVLYERTEK